MLQETPDVMTIQELPRSTEGWAKASAKGKFMLLQHRHPEALGLLYRNDLFTPVWKDATHHSLWTTLQHFESFKRSNGELEFQIAEILGRRPDHAGRTIMLGDTNVHLGWTFDLEAQTIPTARGAKVQTV